MANITNGTVSVTVTGGVGPYQYTLLNAGNMLPVPSNTYPIFTNPVSVLPNTFTFGSASDTTGDRGLQSGSYKVKIVDANGCETFSDTLVVSSSSPTPTSTPVSTPVPTATPVPDPTATAIPAPTATPTLIIECLTNPSIVNIIASNGNKYVFNNSSSYDSNIKYGLGIGTYVLQNIPAAHPMALLNNGVTSSISYSGDNDKKLTKVVDGISYDFYYGDITVQVNNNFDTISVYCYYHGYMGGQNLLTYSEPCFIQPSPTPTPAPEPPNFINVDADPSQIFSGASSLLTWTTTNATSVTINNGVGTFGPNSSTSVNPTTTTTYTLTANGPGGIDTSIITITVAQPTPTATPVPDPTATAIPDPTATPVPDPTATPVPDPTATPVPDPTATAIPDPTATPVPDPTATAIGYYFHGGNADYPFAQAADGLTAANPGDLLYDNGLGNAYAVGNLSTALSWVINQGGTSTYNIETFALDLNNDIVGLGTSNVMSFDASSTAEYYYVALPATAADLTAQAPLHLSDGGIETRAVQKANFTLNGSAWTLYRLGGNANTISRDISFSDND